MSNTLSARASTITARLEGFYLAALRIIILLFATICILGAGYFATDGLRRWLTSTEVPPEAVAVTAEEALTPLIQQKNEAGSAERASSGPSAEAKRAHSVFLTGSFAPYYESYRRLASTYNKTEDKILSREELAKELGYTAEAIDDYAAADSPVAEGLARTARLFQTDALYTEAQVNAVTTAIQDPRLLAKAQHYKAAQKTSRRCSTGYETRLVWDSNSTACSDWYEYPYGCRVRRAVPVQQCEAAYPAGIMSPLDTIKQLDSSYRLAWIGKTTIAEEAAARKSAEREEVKAGAPGRFLFALWVFGGFLVIMFMFLLIAVERHLRRLSAAPPAGASEPSRLAA